MRRSGSRTRSGRSVRSRRSQAPPGSRHRCRPAPPAERGCPPAARTPESPGPRRHPCAARASALVPENLAADCEQAAIATPQLDALVLEVARVALTIGHAEHGRLALGVELVLVAVEVGGERDGAHLCAD